MVVRSFIMKTHPFVLGILAASAPLLCCAASSPTVITTSGKLIGVNDGNGGEFFVLVSCRALGLTYMQLFPSNRLCVLEHSTGWSAHK
jgi:hypothetical protein